MATLFGTVNESGAKVLGSAGWSSSRIGPGRYLVDTTTLPTPPIVVACGYRASANATPAATDNVVIVESVTTESFTIRTHDVSGKADNTDQDAGFSFIAMC